MTKPKKSNLIKTNFSKTDFLISGAKKTFIYLQKAFIEILIIRHFDPKRYIWIETNILGDAIVEILSQMISDYLKQHSSDHVTHKNLDPISSKSKISQWHLITFFSSKMIFAKT